MINVLRLMYRVLDCAHLPLNGSDLCLSVTVIFVDADRFKYAIKLSFT